MFRRSLPQLIRELLYNGWFSTHLTLLFVFLFSNDASLPRLSGHARSKRRLPGVQVRPSVRRHVGSVSSASAHFRRYWWCMPSPQYPWLASPRLWLRKMVSVSWKQIITYAFSSVDYTAPGYEEFVFDATNLNASSTASRQGFSSTIKHVCSLTGWEMMYYLRSPPLAEPSVWCAVVFTSSR